MWIVIGAAILCFVMFAVLVTAILIGVRCGWRIDRSCTGSHSRTFTWHAIALIAVFLTATAIAGALIRPSVRDSAIGFGLAGLAWFFALRAFLKERPQWSLRTMMLVTAAVAILCSVIQLSPRTDEFVVGGIAAIMTAAILLQVPALVRIYRDYRKPSSFQETPSRDRESLPREPPTNQCPNQETPPVV